MQQENKMGIMPVNKLILSMSLPHAISARLKVEKMFKFYWTLVTVLAVISLVLVWMGF